MEANHTTSAPKSGDDTPPVLRGFSSLNYGIMISKYVSPGRLDYTVRLPEDKSPNINFPVVSGLRATSGPDSDTNADKLNMF